MRRFGWLSLIACLVVVGLIRANIPDELPGEYDVAPDTQGVARIDEATVEVVDIQTASAIRSAEEYSEVLFTASPGTLLVLGRFRIVAHGGVFSARSEIRTADGFRYDALNVIGFPEPGAVHVGLSLTTTYVFEIPADKVDGVVGIHGSLPAGVQPVIPVIAFALPDDLDESPGEVIVPEDLLEPVR